MTEESPQDRAFEKHEEAGHGSEEKIKQVFYLAEAVSGAYWPQKGVMAAKEEDIREDIPERIKAELVCQTFEMIYSGVNTSCYKADEKMQKKKRQEI